MTTHEKKQSAAKLLKTTESKKSFISIRDNSSDFSSVKFPREKQTTTHEMRRDELDQINQEDYETTPAKEKEKNRFRDRSSSKKGIESQPNLERNSSNLYMKTMNSSFRKVPHKELAAVRLADAPMRNKRHSTTSFQVSESLMASTGNIRLRTVDANEKAESEGKSEDDPYAASAFNATRQSYYPAYEKRIKDGEKEKVEFEPTASYLHEVCQFKTAHASLRDKVQSFNEATQFWDADKYLKNVHAGNKPHSKERQGRKLNLSQYHERMQKAQKQSSPVRPKRAKIIPDYVIPSE